EQPAPAGLGEFPAVERRGVDAVALEVVGGVIERSAGAVSARRVELAVAEVGVPAEAASVEEDEERSVAAAVRAAEHVDPGGRAVTRDRAGRGREAEGVERTGIAARCRQRDEQQGCPSQVFHGFPRTDPSRSTVDLSIHAGLHRDLSLIWLPPPVSSFPLTAGLALSAATIGPARYGTRRRRS